MKRTPLGKRLRFKILHRDSFTCQYCGAGKDSRLCVDHKIPVSAGGTNDESNLVTACYACNAGKSDQFYGDRARVVLEYRGETFCNVPKDLELLVMLSAGYDVVTILRHEGELFAPLEWLKKEFPLDYMPRTKN